MNVLISSLSKKIPLVKDVRHALTKFPGSRKIIGADSNSECLGKYFVDQFWEMPPLEELSPEDFISYCQFYDVTAVIPTRDGELMFYAQNRELFSQQGIHVMISSEESVQSALDKIQFYQMVNGIGYSAIETVESLDVLEVERFVVKERYGSGSRSIGLNLNKIDAVKHAKKLSEPVFQPFIVGREISVDVYIDQTGIGKGAIARTRDFIVKGESQITTSIRNDSLEKACIGMAEEMGLYGHVMFQVIHEEENDIYLILECNPRFGGASCLSLAMGLDSFYWFLLEAEEEELSKTPFQRSPEEKRLIRYPEDLIL